MDSTNQDTNNWLNAHHDPVASLHTLTQCMTLADINADGEHKLVVADHGIGSTNSLKLKVYKGGTMISENAILDLPTGVVTFYMDTHEPRTPAIAVASGPFIYIYKNLRPYFKFTLPSMEINQTEQELWNSTRDENINTTVLKELLEQLRHQGAALSVRSLRFIRLPDHELETFAAVHKHSPLKRQTVITCLATLKKSMSEEDAISCLVIGTEANQIFILDPEAFTILTTMELASAPVFLSVTGLFDVEFRIIVACRNGAVYMLKRGVTIGKLLFNLNSQPVGLERIGKNVIVGCMDETLQCYNGKGNKLWTIKLPGAVTTMCLMDNSKQGFKAVIVALSNNEVHIYREKSRVDLIHVPDVVVGLSYGKFGREDGSLIMTTKGGGFIVKMPKRMAKFDNKNFTVGPPASQNEKINVPKKTRLFVDQTLRERGKAIEMHRQFQQDLFRIRIEAARAYSKTLISGLNPISSDPEEPLKLSAKIQGMGPSFMMSVNLQNTSSNKPSIGLSVTFDYDSDLYSFDRNTIQIPMLVPGLEYTFETLLHCLSSQGISDDVKVYVTKKSSTIPLITAVITMPVSEPPLD